ncbi:MULTISPECIES: EAL domain-containing protein [unclassified Janthinobacterium]|uniref:bifunctional diguanylate cyclase/phosphodiesterase n=1 Tax=unclassified Janthinobacterium TaxID=2610881 RepID=UPI000888C1EB|nr:MULTISPECIES: EAL domain-containing protein [unclassified Janthinobacterium]SDA75035.1 diguanylate cyclase (GGDEF) domain-containing protein [Janthinobacterium sp. 551a]SFB57958.1 diguanylate cyclase (GGDEF) domain-containing protein [Janthinobacterium sp. 344]
MADTGTMFLRQFVNNNNAAVVEMSRADFLRANLRLILAWPLLCLALCGVLWTATLLQLEAEKKVARQQALDSVASQSKAYGQYLLRTLEQMDQLTLQLKYEWENSRGHLRLDQLKTQGMYALPQFAIVAILDRKGHAVTATAPLTRLRTNERSDFLLRHWRSNSSALRIALGRANGDAAATAPGAGGSLVHFTRRLEDEDGNFDGVLLISIHSSYFSEFYDSVNFGKLGMSAMVGEEGELFSTRLGARVLPADGEHGNSATPFLDTSFLETDSGAMESGGRVAFSDKQNRYVGWQALKAYPFTAVVGLADSEMLHPYEETRTIYIGIALGVTLLLLAFTVIATVLSLRLAWRHHQSEGVRNAYRMATEGTSDGFYIISALRGEDGAIVDFEIVDCNEPGAGYFGVRREQLLGMRLQSRAHEAYFRDLIHNYRAAMQSGFSEEEIELPDGNPFKLRWIRRRLVRSGDRLAVTLQDISTAKEHERDLRRLANEDGLTGLPNRYWLQQFLPGALARAAIAQHMLALLFIDLDGFKDINDTQGHAEGDKVLRAASLRLKAVLRPGDHVVRLGGDEFVVVLDPVEDDSRAEQVAQRIAIAFDEPFYLGSERHKMGASIGISLYPRDGAETDVLLKNADIAMYAVKVAGKGHHRFFQPELFETIRNRRELEQSLVAALEQDQFLVVYQPRVDALSGQLCSMEALVRWRHPQHGMVPPLEFIPVAESSGLISQLGEVVIEKVCLQMAHWQAAGQELVPVSINVSARQFGRGDVHQVLASALARHRIDARMIEVEITESAMMDEQNRAVEQLSAIRALGVRLLVDDFGTGYSSLSQLQKFAMDGLKIDRAFTMELGRSEQGEVFVRAILSMAHALGMSVVAEGVETREQLDILRALQCNEVQGYFISRPVPAEHMLALMRKRFLIPLPAPVLPPYSPVHGAENNAVS